jgi:hypothetical protein
MTGRARLALRILLLLLASALLTLPTVVGALSEPSWTMFGQAGSDACPEDGDTDAGAAGREPENVSACLEFTPELTVPEDDVEPPSVQEIRSAPIDRRRMEAARAPRVASGQRGS